MSGRRARSNGNEPAPVGSIRIRRLPGQAVTVAALGIVQILAWGSTFYLLTILAVPIVADTGWPPTAVTGGVSIGLVVSGLAAPRVGRLIGVVGGRRVMTGGVLLVVAGLTLLASAQSVPVYLLAWAVLGAGMAGALYEAAFSTLGQLYGREARSAITALTLFGGFASTVCWPLSALLVEAIGWRGTCLAYAGLHLVVSLPLCRMGLPRPVPRPLGGPAPDMAALPGLDLRFWCIAVAGICLVGLFTTLSVHLVAILREQGYPLQAAVALGALIGPAQVGARLLEMLGRGRHHPIVTMIVGTGLAFSGMAGIAAGLPAAGLIALGAGNGLWSIVKGALPLVIYPPGAYAAMIGRLATPMLLASAAAPLVGTALIEGLGAGGTLRVLAAVAAVPCIAAGILALHLRRQGGTFSD